VLCSLNDWPMRRTFIPPSGGNAPPHWRLRIKRGSVFGKATARDHPVVRRLHLWALNGPTFKVI